jgi:hypothetical protein
MSEPASPSPRDAWLAASVTITAAIAAVGIVIGFAVLPFSRSAGSSES